MKLMHYKKRDRILDRFNLWPYVLIQAKLRIKMQPHNPNARKWLEKSTFKYLEQKHLRIEARTNRRYIKELAMLDSIMNSETMDIDALKKFVDSNRHFGDEGIRQKIAAITNASTNESKEAISFLRLQCNFLANRNHKQIYQDYLQLHDAGINFFSNEGVVKNRVESMLFQLVEENGIRPYYPEQNARGKFAIFSYKPEGLEDYIYCLPQNSDVTFLIFDETLALPPERRIKERGVTIRYRKFPSDIAPHDTEIELNAARTTAALSAEFIEALGEAVPKHLKDNIITTPLKEALEIAFDDNMFHRTKALHSFVTVLSEHDTACFVYHTLNTPIDHYFNIALSNFGKNRIMFAMNMTSEARIAVIKERTSDNYFGRVIKPIINKTAVKIPEPVAEEIFIKEYNETRKNNSIPNISFAKGEHIAMFCHPKDPNYRKMTFGLFEELAKKYNITLQLFISSSPEGKSLVQEFDKINKQKNYKRSITAFPAEIAEMQKAVKGNSLQNWKQFLNSRILQSFRNGQSLSFAGYDLSYDMLGSIAAFVNGYIEPFMLYEDALKREIAANPPKFLIMCPARIYSSYMLIALAKERGIPVVDLQAVFQSSHPRYKYSRGDVFAMIDSYQRDVYLSAHKLRSNQLIELVGSQNLFEAKNKAATMDAASIRNKLGVEGKKVIIFGCQPGYLEHGIMAISAFAEVVKNNPDCYLIVKTHPREPQASLDAYAKALQDNKLRNCASVISKADIDEVIHISDILITFYSTVGLTAAAAGKHVISVNLTGEPIPDILGEMGVSLTITNAAELKNAVQEMLTGGKAAEESARIRKKFFDENKYIDGDVVARVIEIAEGLCGKKTELKKAV